MKTKSMVRLLLTATLMFVLAGPAAAHCDTMNGPVVKDARNALETGKLEPVLKWVTPAQEAEVRAVFAHVRSVRKVNDDARTLADRFFFETVVRLHRVSEGVGYTGLKEGGLPEGHAVALVDKALADGKFDPVKTSLNERISAELQRRFETAHNAQAHRDHSVEAGRAYVAEYVKLTHLAEAFYDMTSAEASAHGAAPHGH